MAVPRRRQSAARRRASGSAAAAGRTGGEVGVSVITPTYNRPAYLPEAIASVIGQTHRDWEMLVINDGGTDVGQIVRRFDDPRIHYVNHTVNRGKAACLNDALQDARGKYIAYLDDDDCWYPWHLETLAGELDARSEIGAVYSDLYAVQFIYQEKTKKRIPVHKILQASRNFNRSFMMVNNCVLHVSLMHRRDLALRAGGYNPKVRILIDWNIARKMCLLADFLHIPKITGEYYIPLVGSDRISNRGREDIATFRSNIRMIKADLPPQPWVQFEPVTIIRPVYDWTNELTEWIENLFDHISYPFRLLLVNADPKKRSGECLAELGDVGLLDTVDVRTPGKALDTLGLYRYGARRANSRHILLTTENMRMDFMFRLLEGLEQLRKRSCDGIKWDLPEEHRSPYDLLIERRRFLKLTESRKGKRSAAGVDVIPRMIPEAFRSDWELYLADQALKRQDAQTAFKHVQKAAVLENGGVTEPFLMDIFVKVNSALHRYDEIIKKAGKLIISGNYGADNWLRLARALQVKGLHDAALDAFKRGFDEIGMSLQDLDEDPFPIIVPIDFGAFSALMGMGESLVALGRLPEAARVLKHAARLKANSPRPALAFTRLFLKAGELERAAEALDTARVRAASGEELEDLQQTLAAARRRRVA